MRAPRDEGVLSSPRRAAVEAGTPKECRPSADDDLPCMGPYVTPSGHSRGVGSRTPSRRDTRQMIQAWERWWAL